MKENKGFSLIELIIIIAIMAIIATLASISLGAVTGSKVKECAKNIEAILNKARISTMGKDAVEIKLYIGSDENYYVDTVTTVAGVATTTTTKVGKSSLVVKYSYNDDYSSPVVLQGADKLSISFDRSSGGLKPDASNNYCQRIWISNKSETKVRTITIYKETGNVEIE